MMKKIKVFFELCERLQVNPMPRKLSYIGRADNNGNAIDKLFQDYITSHHYDNVDPDSVMSVGNLHNCGACNGNLTIDAYGNVFPCNLMISETYCFGNVCNDKNILMTYGKCSNFNKVKKMKEMNTGACETCEVKNLCWSCLADYVELTKNQHTFDTYCSKRKKAIYSYYFG